MDTIERLVVGVFGAGLSLFTWTGIKDKADAKLMDERHDTQAAALAKMDCKLDGITESIGSMRVEMAKMNGDKKDGN